ncbi:MAG: CPBP family intramembrane metalloprotease, partial [Planctomycetes bacterium]|nr:CPBP family intramembrane metalloprotease [Planctomycetota bacterium]
KKYGPIVGAILNALLFTASHYNAGIGTLIVLGVFLCLIYEKTESILSCIIAHSANNMFAIMSALYFMKKGSPPFMFG